MNEKEKVLWFIDERIYWCESEKYTESLTSQIVYIQISGIYLKLQGCLT